MQEMFDLSKAFKVFMSQLACDKNYKSYVTKLSRKQADAFESFRDALVQDIPAYALSRIGMDAFVSFLIICFEKFNQQNPKKEYLEIFPIDSLWEADQKVSTIFLVQEDKPFLVDSLLISLANLQCPFELLLHPVLSVHIDQDSKSIESIHIVKSKEESKNPFSVIIFILEKELSPAENQSVSKALDITRSSVNLIVHDWPDMRNQAVQIEEKIQENQPNSGGEHIKEISHLLKKLGENFYTFLGSIILEASKEKKLNASKSSLGLFKNISLDSLGVTQKFISSYAQQETFFITKSTLRSSVHRSVPMDIIFVRHPNKTDTWYIFLGLFTSQVYTSSVLDIPYIRKKISYIFEKSKIMLSSHDGKALMHICENFPRDTLMQINAEVLYDIVLKILKLQSKPRLSLFIHEGIFRNYYNCLVYVPKDRYSSELRKKMVEILCQHLNGKMLSYQPYMSFDAPYARVEYFIGCEQPQEENLLSLEDLEQKLAHVSLHWTDHLKVALIKKFGSSKGLHLCAKYQHAYPTHYQENQEIEQAVQDIETIEKVLDCQNFYVEFCQNLQDKRVFQFRIFKNQESIVLTNILPIIENLGMHVLTEKNYKISLEEKKIVWLHEFILRPKETQSITWSDNLKHNLEEAIQLVWEGKVEDDGLNQLVTAAGLSIREIIILRIYCRYLKQIDFIYSKDFVIQMFLEYAAITVKLVQLFYKLLDPEEEVLSGRKAAQHITAFEEQLNTVKTNDGDKIFRQFLNLILSTVRTNYFAIKELTVSSAFCVKFDSRLLNNLPLPRPMYEVFVYSLYMEGIHLRSGKVSRGGIRWSDRVEDFRTEILGLMKAQRVKNVVIIPSGAKGGFVLRKFFTDESFEERFKRGISAYEVYIKTLLSITDNLKNNRIVHPENVRCLDGEDPYLVVAADKGTATFSDRGNGIALEQDFWLGDGFASGGSNGYDHKKMAITAKGAWESVKRHFREKGKNIQTTPFTVVGVGDMSGDVFGNGMLLSPHIKLLGAFNHKHIFLDPNPDPQKSFQERQRLFDLPQSSWENYQQSSLSKGGKIYSRFDKVVSLTPEIMERFHIKKNRMAPDDLIRILLTAEVELLWFGGIGTFVKASTETSAEVNDRFNDCIRVNASQLRCSVIGEGANLGITQLGRIEFARNGGSLNTDAIDNSAGVDCSDHEVNIKILLSKPVFEGKLSLKERNKILIRWRKSVEASVLQNTYLQTQAISLIQSRGGYVLGRQTRFMKALERIGRLNREVEYLPDDEALTKASKNNCGLTRPEISVLLAYGKLFCYEKIVQTNLSEEKYFETLIYNYFPSKSMRDFKPVMATHPLKKEIIAATISNVVVNRMGPAFLNEMMFHHDASCDDVIKAYYVVAELLNAEKLWEEIQSLDNKVEASLQTSMLFILLDIMEYWVNWILKYEKTIQDVEKTVQKFKAPLKSLRSNLLELITPVIHCNYVVLCEKFSEEPIQNSLRETLSYLSIVHNALDIATISLKTKVHLTECAKVYFLLGKTLYLEKIIPEIHTISGQGKWMKKALKNTFFKLIALQKALVENVLMCYQKKDISYEDVYERWVCTHKEKFEKTTHTIKQMLDTQNLDLSMLVVIVKQLENLIEKD